MLKKVHRYEVKLVLKSGMHITGSDDVFDIGGADSQVIKNPLTGEPYIPGSSLKGKLRSLLEYKYGIFEGENLNVSSNDDECLALFESNNLIPQITRGIFRDLLLTDKTKEKMSQILGEKVYTEIKAENKINRFSGKADSPRFIERVPAGSEFVGEIDILEFEGDNYSNLDNYLNEAISLLNYNFIGGSGSRGYGQVDVTVEEIED